MRRVHLPVPDGRCVSKACSARRAKDPSLSSEENRNEGGAFALSPIGYTNFDRLEDGAKLRSDKKEDDVVRMPPSLTAAGLTSLASGFLVRKKTRKRTGARREKERRTYLEEEVASGCCGDGHVNAEADDGCEERYSSSEEEPLDRMEEKRLE